MAEHPSLHGGKVGGGGKLVAEDAVFRAGDQGIDDGLRGGEVHVRDPQGDEPLPLAQKRSRIVLDRALVLSFAGLVEIVPWHVVSLGLQVSKAKHTGESASDLGVR